MPKYQAPPGDTGGINIGGQQFNADASGIVTLPDEGDYQAPAGYERVTDTLAAVAVPVAEPVVEVKPVSRFSSISDSSN